MNRLHVSKSYGEALFRLGREEKINDEIEQQLNEIVRLFDNTQIGLFLQVPSIPKQEKFALADQVFTRNHPYILSLMRLLIDRNRTHYIAYIANEYAKIRDRESHSLRVQVHSRFKMTEKELGKIRKRLANLSGQNVHLTLIEDPSIAGGIRLLIQDRLLDGTVSAQLDVLRKNLLESLENSTA